MENSDERINIYTIRDFLKQDIDIDVDIGQTEIAYCGPTELTEEGEKEFASILDDNIVVNLYEKEYHHLDYASVVYPGTHEKVKLIEKLFWWIAGYCSEEDWERLFYYPEDEQS